MYYLKNVKTLGENKCMVYSNMYINFLTMGCKYKNQEIINNLCPEFIRDNCVNNINVPYYFTY
jgi:hypothetical protein